jgi:hypothetical protein
VLEGTKPTLAEIEALYSDYQNHLIQVAQRQALPGILDSQFNSLPAAIRAQCFPLKAAIKLALEQSDFAAAREMVVQAIVPSELSDLKQSMINAMDAALSPTNQPESEKEAPH